MSSIMNGYCELTQIKCLFLNRFFFPLLLCPNRHRNNGLNTTSINQSLIDLTSDDKAETVKLKPPKPHNPNPHLTPFHFNMIIAAKPIDFGPNAQNIFVKNGNPSNDLLQIETLKTHKNEIDECLKDMKAANKNEKDKTMNDNKSKINFVENEQKKMSKTQQRKRSTRQRLKVRKEESESFVALNE